MEEAEHIGREKDGAVSGGMERVLTEGQRGRRSREARRYEPERVRCDRDGGTLQLERRSLEELALQRRAPAAKATRAGKHSELAEQMVANERGAHKVCREPRPF